jgi:molecular chaperone HscB
MQNHFELFHLPQQFALDRAALDAAYREVQGQVHPDRFVNATDAEKRTAMQWATRANDAYQTLRNPLKRAEYLCELNGYGLQAESNTAMSVEFLMQQMEWRENLENARDTKDASALEGLSSELRSIRNMQMERIEQLLDARDFAQTVQEVRQMMFVEKFGEDISFAFDALDSTE